MKIFKNRDWIYQKYIKDQLSTTDVAIICKCGREAVRRRLIKFGIPRRKKHSIKTKNKIREKLRNRIINRKGKNNPNWKGKKRINRSTLYFVWIAMKQRCLNPKSFSYKWYGNRGIFVCEEWRNSYQNFKNWALSNGYTNNLTIDRINNNDGYKPNNCQWITQSENSKKSKYKK